MVVLISETRWGLGGGFWRNPPEFSWRPPRGQRGERRPVPTAWTPSKHNQTCNDPGSETRRKPSLRRPVVLMQVRQDASLIGRQSRNKSGQTSALMQPVHKAFSFTPWALPDPSPTAPTALEPPVASALQKLPRNQRHITASRRQHTRCPALQLQAPQDPVLASPLAWGLRTTARLLFPRAALIARRACISGEPVSTRTTWIPDSARRRPTPKAESARCDSSMRCRRGRRWNSGGS